MEFRRSMVSGSSSARSGSNERDINQESQLYSKFPLSQEPIQPISFGSNRCPKSKSVQTIVTTADNQQIIKDKIYTTIPKDQSISLRDICPGVSITQDAQGRYILKETQLQINCRQQRPIKEEDARSSDRDHGQPAR
ncbi:MAG: hypothetical protein GY861_28175 [bacterium]|nr:hypothetical protein [bacterium]